MSTWVLETTTATTPVKPFKRIASCVFEITTATASVK
jgi:hypothetical protein